MKSRARLSEVKAGLRRAAFWLLGMGWLGLVFAGMAIAFTPSPHSPAVGWLLLAAAAIILIATMDKWVGVFSALLACSILGGILTITEGHAVNHPEVKVSHLEGVVITAVLAASAVVSFTFTKRRLRLLDRVALFVFVFCFFWQAADSRVTLLALGAAFCSLLVAWGYDRTQRRRDPDHQSGAPLESFGGNTAK